MSSPARFAACLLAVSLALAAPRRAQAQEPPQRRVVVLRFTGAQAARARSAVVSGIERKVELVDVDEFSTALDRAQGATRPDRIAAACRTVGVDAVIEGNMSRVRRAWGVEVVVRNCENGEKMTPGGRAVYSMRNLGGIGAIRSSIWSRVGASVLSCGGGARVASREAPPAGRGARPRGGGGTTARPGGGGTTTARPRPRNDVAQCLFEEDEPPEGFPGHGDWVRRRNAFLVRCQREHEEAERRRVRAEEDRRRRAEEARLAEERHRREEAERRRAEAEERAQREEAERRAAEARWRREQEERRRAEERRREEQERRAQEDRAEAEARERAEAERRRRASEIEQRVAAYRDRLRREREQDGGGDGDPDVDDDRDRDRDRDPDTAGGGYDDSDYGDGDDGGDGGGDGGDADRDDPDRDRDRDVDRARTRRDDSDDDRWYERDRRDRDRDRRDDGDGGDGDADGDVDADGDADADADGDRGRDGDDADGGVREVLAKRRKPTIFAIGAGIAFMNRSMSVEVLSSDKPRTYSAPGYPEMTIGLEFYPVALASPTSGASGLGVFGLYRRHLFLQTSGPTDLGETIDVATGEQELLLGAVFKTVMGRSASSPTLTLSAGYGYFAFELDPVQMSLLRAEVQMPTMIYRNFVIQAGIAIPVTRSGIALEFGGSYRYVVDVGQAARDLFGDQTTGGNGFGARAAIGGEAAFLTEGLFWSLSADYFVFTTEFSGSPLDPGGPLDQFPSGTDQYIRGLFLAAYRFR